jgi:leucyl aminopeptidase
MIIHTFYRIVKIDYKSLKTIARRISAKEKSFWKNVALFVPEEFSSNEVEAIVSGLLLGTYNLGHFKRRTILLNPDFELEIISSKDYAHHR